MSSHYFYRLAGTAYWKPSTELPELIMFWLGWIALAIHYKKLSCITALTLLNKSINWYISSILYSLANDQTWIQSQQIITTSMLPYFIQHSMDILAERVNFRPIISWHIILLGPQRMVNYKAPCTATSFYYHYSETNRDLPSVLEIKT